jgi:integrase
VSEKEVVSYGGSSVALHLRGNGLIALRWREDGKWRTTTRQTLEDAKKWARKKAFALDQASGAQWVTPAAKEQLEWLRRLAGGAEGVPGMLSHLEAALGVAKDAGRLAEAARWFMAQGGAEMQQVTVRVAVADFLGEYEKKHPAITVRGPRSEMKAFVVRHGGVMLEAITPGMLGEHIARGGAGKRTQQNRHAYWTLFFNWAVRGNRWPRATPPPIAHVTRKKPDKVAPVVFLPEEGRKLLAAVSAKEPQHLAYLIIAGWLGCRPSECVRLLWTDLDEEQGLLHVRAEVARKVAAERWVPVPVGVMKLLVACREAVKKQAGKRGHICRVKAQNVVSEVARRAGLTWSIDVLRHSRITYRLQELHDIGRVAEESGNSPSEIRASYKRPIPPGRWVQWMAALEAAVPGDWVAPVNREWTAEELALLGTLPDAEVGLKTGRPTASVLQKRLKTSRGKTQEKKDRSEQ